MGTIYFLKKLYQKWVRRTAKTWPITQGSIEHVRARTLDKDEGRGWVGELAYSYIVNGQYFAGFHHFTAKSEEHADELIEGWKDRKVMIRYRMDKPEISALLLDEQEQLAFTQNQTTLPWIANPS
ncbi:MAG TPA: hypothetical protein VGF44_06130 [Terriglobales bacterium]|jgi:hypothetical protein